MDRLLCQLLPQSTTCRDLYSHTNIANAGSGTSKFILHFLCYPFAGNLASACPRKAGRRVDCKKWRHDTQSDYSSLFICMEHNFALRSKYVSLL